MGVTVFYNTTACKIAAVVEVECMFPMAKDGGVMQTRQQR